MAAAGIGRFDGLSPQSAEYRRTLEKHRSKEAGARRWARIVVFKLRAIDQRAFGRDETLLRAWASRYHISPDHVDLFVEIVMRTIDKDLGV